MSEIRVFKFGLLPPVENAAVVERQMRLAHRYRNDLIYIERQRRAAVRAVLSDHPQLKEAEAAYAKADAELTAALKKAAVHRSAGRTRKLPPELTEEIKALRAERSNARKRCVGVRVHVRIESKLRIEEIDVRATELTKGARALSGLYWGTYLVIEQAMDASRKMPYYDGAEPNDPRFIPRSDEGTVAVQIQNGLSFGEVRAAEDTRVRVTPRPLPGGASPNSRRSVLRPRAYLDLRISSDGRAPVWGRWPMIPDREIPNNAKVKWVHVTKRMIGPRAEWFATFTVELESVTHRCGKGRVGVDLGWRKLEDGSIRVAAWHGDDGKEGFVVVPVSVIERLDKVASLRSIRDKAFDETRGALAQWLADPTKYPKEAGYVSLHSLTHAHRLLLRDDPRPTPDVVLPVWLKEATATLSAWKSPARLAGLVRRWLRPENRFDGDSLCLAALEEWRHHDHHLLCWESDQRVSTLRHRKELYRIAAAQLAGQYETLVLEDMDLRELAVTPAVDSGETAAAPGQRQAVAPSEARAALVQAFGKARVEKKPAAGTTLTCYACKSQEIVAIEHIEHACTGCGLVWDQDINAAINLCRVEEGSRDTLEVATTLSQAKGGRWAKAKLAKEERGRAAP